MTLVAVTLKREWTVQWRNGFFAAALFVAIIYSVLLRVLSDWWQAEWLPFLLFSNLLIGTFYFTAGLVLLEKDEGVANALRVTPIPKALLVLARVLSLTAIALGENLLWLVLGGQGAAIEGTWLVALAASAAWLCLLGGRLVQGYGGINDFLMPSFVMTLVICAPMVTLLGLGESVFWWLHPTYPFVRLFGPVDGGWLLAWAIALGWLALAGWWASRVSGQEA